MDSKIILILDIDGVLITTPPWKSDEIDIDGYSKFNLQCVENLNTLLKAKEMDIWLSSSRRKAKKKEELNQIFKQRGINTKISGFLPVNESKMSRKEEVESFLEKKKYTKYLIIDDDKTLNGLNDKNYLVQTDLLRGFDFEKLREAQIILQQMDTID